MKIEGLVLFVARAPFAGFGGADVPLDRKGPWTDRLLYEAPDAPRAGLWVWEGHAEPEPDYLVGGHDLIGAWRAPTAEEMQRLAEGRFPLRGHPFPAGEPEAFEAPR